LNQPGPACKSDSGVRVRVCPPSNSQTKAGHWHWTAVRPGGPARDTVLKLRTSQSPGPVTPVGLGPRAAAAVTERDDSEAAAALHHDRPDYNRAVPGLRLV
jgi:hypothetical protein